MPWVDYWTSSCLYLISFHRMSVPLYAEFIQCSSVLPIAASWNLDIQRRASGLTTNSPCLSVCPCHKTFEIWKRNLACPHTRYYQSRKNCWCHRLKLAVCDTIGPRRPEMTSQQIKETILCTAEAQKCHYHTEQEQWRMKRNGSNTRAMPQRRSHVNLWCLLALWNVCLVLNWQGTF